MARDVRLKMVIPIPDRDIPGGVALLTFASWLPLLDKDAIIIERNDMTARLGFDVSDLEYPHVRNPDELANHGNIMVSSIRVDLQITNIKDEVVEFLAHRDGGPRDIHSPIAKETEEITNRIFDFIIPSINRIVTYFRTEKGQFWIEEIKRPEHAPIDLLRYKAQFTVDDGKTWHWWSSTSTVPYAAVQTGRDTHITKDDWGRAEAFLKSNRRAPLELDLLATAYADAWNGRRRSALIDAVSALEIAAAAFVTSPRAQEAFGADRASRIGVESLKNQWEHFGLRYTVRYLIPIILTEDVLPTSTIRSCQDAIEHRNNVVHNGYRDVKTSKIFEYLGSIRKLCDILRSYTDTSDD